MKICHCGKQFDIKSARTEPAPASYEARNVLVCSKCDGLHHAIQEPVAMVRGPVNARHLSHTFKKQSGQTILTWKVGSQDSKVREEIQTVEFYPWPRRNPMSETEPLLYTCWNQLMGKVDIIINKEPVVGKDNTEYWLRAKAEARGMAELLATLMQPFMQSADDVVKAAVKKCKNPDYEVPGLGEHLWDPMKNPDGSWRTPISSPKSAKTKPVARPKAKPAAKRQANERQLKDSEIQGIKEALQSGMFKAEEVASIFKVSVEQVNEVTSD